MAQHEPQSNPQSVDRFDATWGDLQRALDRELTTPAPAAPATRAGPPAPRPAVAAGPPAPASWGPSSPRAITPIQLLVKVANDAHALLKAVEDLRTEVTGEEPEYRGKPVGILPASLLPAIAELAHEIEQVHGRIGQAIHHLRSKL